MEACEWTFASGILASHLSVHSITFNQHQVSAKPRSPLRTRKHFVGNATVPWPIMQTMLGCDIN